MKYPGLVRTPDELHALQPLAAQQGPIVGLLPPISGRYCTFPACTYATSSSTSASKHWLKHKNPETGKPAKPPVMVDGSKGSIWETGFQEAPLGIQTFSTDRGVQHFFRVPGHHQV